MTLNVSIRDFIAKMLPSKLFPCKNISIPEYAIDFSGNSEIRIAHISDLHSNDYGVKQGVLVQAVKDTRPDLIFMTGDIFDKDMGTPKTFDNVKYLMEGIAGICPIYYVIGNHEFFTDEKPFLKAISSYGAKVLSDEAVSIRIKGCTLIIAAIADPFQDLTVAQRRNFEEDNKEAYRKRLEALAGRTNSLKAAAMEEKDECRTILLAHRPEYIDDYAKHGFDVIFSGHAHGGQWIVPHLINGVYAVGQGIFPKYAGGLYKVKESTFIVSRGLSYQKPSFPRFGNPCEMPLVKLKL